VIYLIYLKNTPVKYYILTMDYKSKSIAIIIPSRSRPHNIKRLHDQWYKVTNPDVKVDCFIILDSDNHEEYERLPGFIYRIYNTDGKRGVVAPLNKFAVEIASRYDYIGFIGDDHLPITQNWNSKMAEVLVQNGNYAMVFGNDLYQKDLLCTHIIMDSQYVINLGYFAHPDFTHLWCDNLWMYLGKHKNNCHYLKDVVIEHLHFVNNKSKIDYLYKINNSLEGGGQIFKRIINSEQFKESLKTLV
jgi:hypothetical protein